ncbi:DUF1801 domain-containing protein [Candidatus Woesearchaeota archaeon]|nr:DUF1801 domain-containing protein [Candidatus Woesearchaeota archaeon]
MAYKNTDEYISTFPEDVQTILQKVRTIVKKAVPKSDEAMVYGVPGFKLNGKNLVAYAAFKSHLGIYPEPEAIIHFKKELEIYETSKGAIKFPLDKQIPFSLIEKIIKFKVSGIKK